MPTPRRPSTDRAVRSIPPPTPPGSDPQTSAAHAWRCSPHAATTLGGGQRRVTARNHSVKIARAGGDRPDHAAHHSVVPPAPGDLVEFIQNQQQATAPPAARPPEIVCQRRTMRLDKCSPQYVDPTRMTTVKSAGMRPKIATDMYRPALPRGIARLTARGTAHRPHSRPNQMERSASPTTAAVSQARRRPEPNQSTHSWVNAAIQPSKSSIGLGAGARIVVAITDLPEHECALQHCGPAHQGCSHLPGT